MKKSLITALLYALICAPICLNGFTSCNSSSSASSSEPKWKPVTSLEQFKQQFRGTTWECSNESYSMKFVEENGRITEYCKLHLPNSGWSKDGSFDYEIYDGYSMYEGNYIRVRIIDEDGESRCSLHFTADGTPGDYVRMGMGLGHLYISE